MLFFSLFTVTLLTGAFGLKHYFCDVTSGSCEDCEFLIGKCPVTAVPSKDLCQTSCEAITKPKSFNETSSNETIVSQSTPKSPSPKVKRSVKENMPLVESNFTLPAHTDDNVTDATDKGPKATPRSRRSVDLRPSDNSTMASSFPVPGSSLDNSTIESGPSDKPSVTVPGPGQEKGRFTRAVVDKKQFACNEKLKACKPCGGADMDPCPENIQWETKAECDIACVKGNSTIAL